MADLSHVEAAGENEALAASLDRAVGAHRNWIVTIRFYALLHYVDARLIEYGYKPEKHHERGDAIRDCDYLDAALYKVYRMLYDLSEDARYKCVRMSTEDVRVSNRQLERGKKLAGFDHGDDGTTKYSVS